MKITEIVLDWITSTKLFEMAFSRKDLINRVSAQDWQVDSHLLKVLMYGKVAAYNHWCQELNAALSGIQRLKLQGNKRLSSDKYFELLWKGFLETPNEVQDHMSEIDREYSRSFKLINYNPNEVHKEALQIMQKVCDDLSLGKFVSIQDYLP